MAWTAKIIERHQDPDGTVIVNVDLTDGTRVVSKMYRVAQGDVDGLKTVVKSDLDKLTAQDALASGLTPGNFDTTITPPAKTAKEQYADALANWLSMRKAISYGFMVDTDPNYVALTNQLKTNFRQQWLDLF